MADRKSIVITILALIVVIMVLVIVYAFVIQPAISGYTVQQQNAGAIQGANYVLSQIVGAARTCQPFALPIGNNQTIHLIALECYQQQPAAQAQTPAQTTQTQGTTTPAR